MALESNHGVNHLTWPNPHNFRAWFRLPIFIIYHYYFLLLLLFIFYDNIIH